MRDLAVLFVHLIYVAVTHSGVTLAPVLGEDVRRELLDEQRIDELEPYRPDRFTI